MLLSVVIPAFNEQNQIGGSLQRIEQALVSNQQDGLSWELIVCDNNSTDQTAAVASEFGATVVFEPVNQISLARNTGASIARGDWLLFIDADSYPSSELMAEVLDLASAGHHIGCGSTITVKDGTLFNKLRLERLNPLFRLFRLCGGVFILCEREAFTSIGGFSLSVFALEEIDFVIRLKRYGRTQRKLFAILHRNPVFTSGRKGGYGIRSFARICVSNVAAVVLLLLSLVLPPKFMPKAPSFLLSYWYGRGS